MLLSLLTLLVPALTGFLLRRYRPVLAHRIGRFVNPIAVGKDNYLSFLNKNLFSFRLSRLCSYIWR